MNYDPLTKIIIGQDGREYVTCSMYGTEKCRLIHTSQGCIDCPVMAAILNQLHIFEEIYMEGTNDGFNNPDNSSIL